MANTIKIVDLLAQFNLDAGPLIKGLQDTEVRIDETGAKVMTLDALLKQMGEGSRFGTRFQRQFDEIRAAAQLANEQIINMAAQEKELQRMLVEEERLANQQKIESKRAYAAEVNAILRANAEQHKLVMAQEAFDVKRAVADEKAERTRYNTWWARALREQEEAQAIANANFAKNVTASPIGQQIAQAEIAMANMTRSSGRGRGGSMAWLAEYFQSMTTSQALTEIIGVKIPNAMGRILSYSAPMRAAMMSIFDVVMVAAFVDVLYQVGTQIHTLIRDWEGFDAASIKAWDNASKGATQARRDLIEYRDMMRETAQAGLKGGALDAQKGLDDKASQQDRANVLVQLRAQTKEVSALLTQAEQENKDFYKNLLTSPGMVMFDDAPATKRMKEQGDTLETLREKYANLQAQIREYSREYARLGEDVKRDALKGDREPNRGNKLRGPEDHEEAYRLPWYMGPNAAEAFANKVHGQRMSGLPSAMGGMKARSATSGSASPSATVEVNTTIAPQFVFHGVPADIQAFMRDHAEPQLAKDIANNTRGIGTSVVRALKESGMVVSGG